MHVTRRTLVRLGGLALLTALLRLPSFVEPAWYDDAGTYADIGYFLNHGARLYVDVWDNKPPGIYWTAQFIVAHGPPALGMTIAATTAVALTALLVWRIGAVLRHSAMGWHAALLYVVIASFPRLDGGLFNAEVPGALATAAAVALVVAVETRAWRLLAAGICVAAAVCFKAVFAADGFAILTLPLVLTWINGHGRGRAWRDMATLAGGGAAGVAIIALALARTGSLGPALKVLLGTDVAYVGASGSKFSAAPRAVQNALTLSRTLVPLVACWFLAWRAARRGHIDIAVPLWWLGGAMAGAMLSARGFAHYAQEVEAPVALVIAAVTHGLLRARPHLRLTAVVATVATYGVCQAVVWLPGAELAALTEHRLVGLPPPSSRLSLADMPRYYGDTYGHLLGVVPESTVESLYPVDFAQRDATVAFFDTLPQSRPVFIWGDINWTYVLSDRQPAARYLALNSQYALIPTGPDDLVADLERSRPDAIVVQNTTPPPQLSAFLARNGYHLLPSRIGGDPVWVLPH